MKHGTWFLIALFLSTALTFACDEAEDSLKDAVAEWIEGVPDDVSDFLDEDDLKELEELGLDIYTGENPPAVFGDYYLDSLVIEYDTSGNEGMQIVPYDWHYTAPGGRGDLTCSYESDATTGMDDVAEGLAGWTSGEGNCFTVYIDFAGNANGCEYKMPMVQSGCLTDGGIKDFTIAYVMKDKDELNPACLSMMPIDAKRITVETDKLAESK